MKMVYLAAAVTCCLSLFSVNSVAEVEEIRLCSNAYGKMAPCQNEKHEFRDGDLIVMKAIARGITTKSNPGAESIGLNEAAEPFSRMNSTELTECIKKQSTAAFELKKMTIFETSSEYMKFVARKIKFLKDMETLNAEKESLNRQRLKTSTAKLRKAE